MPGPDAALNAILPVPGPVLDPAEILRGLRARPRAIPARYFYDAEGSRLFEEICGLPEYYPTRTETSILRARAPEIARLAGSRAGLIEYGSGSSRKTRLLLDALAEPAYYAPLDISPAALAEAVDELAAEYPALPVHPICADYMNLDAPPLGEDVPRARRLLFFPGSTIGNLHRGEARALLRRMRAVAGGDGALLIGIDLRKDPAVLERAYNDSRGITAAFNLNLLRRVNRETGAAFPLDAFRHRAFFNAGASRIEMHLEALRDVRTSIGGAPVALKRGESIHTENSYKYEPEDFGALTGECGFVCTARWTDPRRWFGVFYCEAC